MYTLLTQTFTHASATVLSMVSRRPPGKIPCESASSQWSRNQVGPLRARATRSGSRCS